MLLVYLTLGLIIGVISPVFFDGIERKLKAYLQSRIGPPITQTLYDLLKLINKEVKPIHTTPFIVLYLLSFISSTLASILMVEIYVYTGESLYITLGLSLLAISLTSLTIAPLLVPNPFSYAGGMREVVLALINESAFIVSVTMYISLINNLLQTEALSIPLVLSVITITITMFVSGYALTGRAPFDIAEAEPELASGILVEFSGKLLAAYLYCNLLKRFLITLITAGVITAPLIKHSVFSLATTFVLTVVLWIVFAVISVILGRSRVDLAPKTLAKTYILFISLSITGLLVHAYG